MIGYGTNIVRNGLVLHLDAANPKSYPGSGTTWYDLSGNGNHGTLTNGPTFNSANKGSIVFDGSDDSAYITNNSLLNFGTQDFTVSFFLYVPSSNLNSQTEYGIINKNPTYQNNAGWGLEVSTWGKSPPYDLINAYFYNTGQTSWGNSNVNYFSLKSNVWNQITSIRALTNGKLYVNGILVAEKTHNDIALNVNNNNNIIIADHAWGPNFKGNISQVQIYNRALSSQEISQNFEATRGRYSI